ncbi:transcriptional regulator, ArsR family [Thalassolituus maritimus]|uniref:Transcriptional regulator, ArsR family n=1 Tax=Thalassolituus maritimus TaxID=484498 RepID=A0A1N7NZL2_9GAMM|nr:metalloregulator ArsR/SmtB family transcription factor [Thalassolituus maritimus]SIT03773.1 transcriptional regulator, ArsR family [Thalassolituus maritimus]
MNDLTPDDLTLARLAQASKAAGDPLRMGVMKLLGQGAFGVLELCQIFDIKQSSMSHHLKVLSQAGLVSSQREGNSIFYRRPLNTGDDVFSHWLRSLFRAMDATHDDIDLSHAVSGVLAERAEACASFFARHADDFREQQDLIASYEQYGEALATILDSLGYVTGRDVNSGYALEIGPGEGAFLQPLSKRFEGVTGLDISPDLLSRAETFCEKEQLNNVTLVQGDTRALLESVETLGSYGFAVANMVLHHVPSPKNIFNDVAQLLHSGGTFLVTDLCRHEQVWARESCGDLWLGFEPADLSQWAADAGLKEGQSQYSGLRNGFQIQFRLFHA